MKGIGIVQAGVPALGSGPGHPHVQLKARHGSDGELSHGKLPFKNKENSHSELLLIAL
jgi:hypothetical protein